MPSATAVSKKRKGDSSSSSSGRITGVLDQDEVMKAMLQAKAQAEAATQSDGSDSSDSGDSDSEDSDEDDSGHESGDSDSNGESDSGVGSSRSSRSSPSTSAPPVSTPAPASMSIASTSRVKLPPRSDPKGKSANGDDDGIFASAPRPAAETTFSTLGLSPPVISALASINIRKPTEIQSACVGPILAGRDVIGGAKTGSGKTMAFALPILERIARDPFGVYAVVLTPTRELAYQLTEQFLVIGRPLGLTTVTIVGGMDMLSQAKELERRPHVIVATPGRLCDLLRSDGVGQGKLSRVRVLVLDEADRMLTPTFAPELAYLFSQIPAKRQTCLFTATISDAIMDLAKKPPPAGKQPPFVYRVASDSLTVESLKQKYLFIPSQIRDPYLYYLLLHPPEDIDVALRAPPKPKAKPKPKNGKRSRRDRNDDDDDDDESNAVALNIPSTIIFTQRCATAHLLHLVLNSLDIPSVSLHSHLTQPQRLLSLARFRARDIPVLVTTDVGSRGLDIPEVAMVINWDCPRRADDYVHRVGRTARAGRGGVAVTIVTERDVELVKRIEDEVKVTLTELDLPEEPVLEHLNKVSLARRMASMEMHDSGFGERQAVHKAKAIKRARRDAAL